MPELNVDKPWISFCMSTYKRAGILKRTLELFSRQTFANWELVISDNDPDRSAEPVVAAAGDHRLRYFANGTNLGMIGSFNKSFQRSRGQFVVFITDDDPVYPHMVQTLYDLHLKYPGYTIYAGGHDTVFTGLLQARMAKANVGTNSSLAQWDLAVEKTFDAPEFCRAFLDGTIGGSMLWSVCAVKRDVVVAIDGLPDYGTPQMCDIGFLLLSGARGGAAYVNIALGC
ncbi:MAG: glycosyltransferase family 2 protein, partial [Bacteroidetes bacterium]|nr:glycosyltransferase family 2 protein [Bacteroidota bacterium]